VFKLKNKYIRSKLYKNNYIYYNKIIKMNILIKKNPSELITPETINFIELVRNSNTSLSLNCESKMIDLLNKEFTEQESQWYITNLYIYLNYHPTNDYPINLENVYKMLGFANKGNAMKTIKSNFIKDEDYKIVIFRTEKNINGKDLSGKDEKAANIGIGKINMRNIIKNQEKHNNYYYIEYSKCPLNIIEKYDKPIFGINSVHAKKIKQINPITHTHVYFNNLNEIQLKLGICSKTIINSINDKTLYAGSLWEYS